MMTDKELLDYCLSKEAHAFTGWDFSYIGKDYNEGKLPWDYRKKLEDFLKPESELLDIGTGGGEFLLSLRHSYSKTAVTEGYPPNYELCKSRLEPLGIEVKFAKEEGKLPFEDSRFDLIIDRHESYRLSEVFRVLRPGGFFVTQQVGGANNRELSEALIAGFRPAVPDFNLENEQPKFRHTGFRIMNRSQCYVKTTFTDIGALCYYAKYCPGSFLDFPWKAASSKSGNCTGSFVKKRPLPAPATGLSLSPKSRENKSGAVTAPSFSGSVRSQYLYRIIRKNLLTEKSGSKPSLRQEIFYTAISIQEEMGAYSALMVEVNRNAVNLLTRLDGFAVLDKTRFLFCN